MSVRSGAPRTVNVVALMMLIAAPVCSAPPSAQEIPSGRSPFIDRRGLEVLRQKGDLQAERRHVWELITRFTHRNHVSGQPVFETWYGEDAVFATDDVEPRPGGIRAFARVSADPPSASHHGRSAQSADVPILTYTLYNEAAYHHIRRHRLYLAGELDRLTSTSLKDRSITGDRSVPAFPADAIVLKTAWWPVAHNRLTPLPVWDPEHNPPRRSGNDYTSWARVVAVDSSTPSRIGRTASVEFGGQSFQDAHRIDLDQFYHVAVDAEMAVKLAQDPSAKKMALIVLGRTIQAGDYLVLVAANLATKEIDDWVWAALWWHDRAADSPFAAERPPTIDTPWHNYLLQVAFDSVKPPAQDSGPHICFNPWLEGRFPQGDQGGGTSSNCLACHRRASFPPISFLPVTRGPPDRVNDPAYAPGRLRTNFLWSLALHARPEASVQGRMQ